MQTMLLAENPQQRQTAMPQAGWRVLRRRRLPLRRTRNWALRLLPWSPLLLTRWPQTRRTQTLMLLQAPVLQLLAQMRTRARSSSQQRCCLQAPERTGPLPTLHQKRSPLKARLQVQTQVRCLLLVLLAPHQTKSRLWLPLSL